MNRAIEVQVQIDQESIPTLYASTALRFSTPTALYASATSDYSNCEATATYQNVAKDWLLNPSTI
eukprot:scaffold330575_cov37-Prasinocladus_malaysianus.AAC.1